MARKPPVLLKGKTGVGKRVRAHWIHNQSNRQSKPFVEVNGSSMGGDLLGNGGLEEEAVQ